MRFAYWPIHRGETVVQSGYDKSAIVALPRGFPDGAMNKDNLLIHLDCMNGTISRLNPYCFDMLLTWGSHHAKSSRP